MTHHVTPATDEEVERARAWNGTLCTDETLALIARIDAERAEKDAALISSGDTILKAAQESSTWRARVAQAEAERDAERAARERAEARAERAEGLLRKCEEHLDDFYDDSDEFPGCVLLREVRAALSQEKEGGK